MSFFKYMEKSITPTYKKQTKIIKWVIFDLEKLQTTRTFPRNRYAYTYVVDWLQLLC